MTPNSLIATGEVARLLGVEPVTVRSYIKRGYLHPQKIGRDWLFTRAEVEALRAHMPKPGNPRKTR